MTTKAELEKQIHELNEKIEDYEATIQGLRARSIQRDKDLHRYMGKMKVMRRAFDTVLDELSRFEV